MLPPGKGGTEITNRKGNDMTIHHVGRDAADYEAQRLEMLKRWQPNHDWMPGMLAKVQRYS